MTTYNCKKAISIAITVAIAITTVAIIVALLPPTIEYCHCHFCRCRCRCRYCRFYCASLEPSMVLLNHQFPSIDAARKAIKAFVLDYGESYKLVASNKRRYIISCKDSGYKFRIRAIQRFRIATKRPCSSMDGDASVARRQPTPA